MKKALIIIIVLLFLCVSCSVVLFIFRGSIPFLKDINLENIFKTGTNNISTNLTQSVTPTDENFNATINGTQLNINSTDKTWPSEIPSNVPEFKYGSIETVNTVTNDESKIWSIIYENINSSAFENYKSDLESNGFADLNVIQTTDGWSINTIKDGLTIIAGYNDSEGLVNIMISIEQ